MCNSKLSWKNRKAVHRFSLSPEYGSAIPSVKPVSGTREGATGMAEDSTICRTKQLDLEGEGIPHIEKNRFCLRCIFAPFN